MRVFSIFCCEWPVLYVSLYGDEWKNRSPGIYYLKSLETLVNSNLQIYPMEYYSVRKGLELWRRLTNQILSHKTSFGPFSLMPHSSYPKRPPSKIDFFEKKPNEILGPLRHSLIVRVSLIEKCACRAISSDFNTAHKKICVSSDIK